MCHCSNDSRADARREAGDRTRVRLLEATKTLVAERGAATISVRDIAEAADANIAAVSYHFGSKENLCRAAIEDAIGTIVSAHLRSIVALPANASVEQISNAMVLTTMKHMTSKDERDRAMMQFSARAILSGSTRASYERLSKELFDALSSRLRVALPNVEEQELRFRAQAAASILHAAAAGALRPRTRVINRSELVRWLISTVRGCLCSSTIYTR